MLRLFDNIVKKGKKFSKIEPLKPKIKNNQTFDNRELMFKLVKDKNDLTKNNTNEFESAMKKSERQNQILFIIDKRFLNYNNQFGMYSGVKTLSKISYAVIGSKINVSIFRNRAVNYLQSAIL